MLSFFPHPIFYCDKQDLEADLVEFTIRVRFFSVLLVLI